ncbi:MAG: OprO/OprP family phosphate-selective porin [Planctomycetes bacterium]|nr:OprO/OprP family phosphate-selective porin [Planctomycetota bacterium]
MTRFSWSAIALLAFAASSAYAEDKTLEERVKALEMKTGGAGPAPASEAGKEPLQAWFDKGLWFRAGNGMFEGRIGVYGIFHYTWNGQLNEGDGKIDGFKVKEAGLEAYGRFWKAFEVYINPRMFPTGTTLKFGWVEFNKWEELKVKVGVFKEPYSPETYTDGVRTQDMPELSLLSVTVPGRDIGAMVHGKIAGGIFGYAIGVFNGNGADPGSDENSDKDVAARISSNPGAGGSIDFIKNLFLGISVTRGKANHANGVTPFAFSTPATGTNFFFDQAGGSTFRCEDNVTRFGADFAWCWSFLEIKAEYSYFKAQVDFDNNRQSTFRSHSWYGSAGVWIGGHRTPGKRPEIDKNLFDGGMGGLNIVGRISKLHVNDVFEEQAGFGGSRNATEFALCVNWYPNPYVRISAMFVQYEYDKQRSRRIAFGADQHVSNDENAVIIRAQVDF